MTEEHHERADHYALVTPSARPDCPAGAWQVTRFDDDGPMGHTFAAPGDALTNELVALGFMVPMEGIIDRKGGDMAEWPERLRVRQLPREVKP